MKYFQFFLRTMGAKGLIMTIAIITFIYVINYAQNIFRWAEERTVGTRNKILEEIERLFIQVEPRYITLAIFLFSAGSAIVTLALFGMISQWAIGLIFAVGMFFLGWQIPMIIVRFLTNRRIMAYQAQMVDGLTLLSNGIRAGQSLQQSVGMVVSEMPAPLSEEFDIILKQNRLGVNIDECFENLVKRIPDEDNLMFVTSVNILRETGGNLAETFDTIVSIIRERVRLKQKIDTFTAQGMFQGFTIFSMPFLIGLIYFVSDPEGMGKVYTSILGIILFIVAIGLDVAGLIIILKIVKIKV
jgi:tight adherence protein B